MGSHGRLKKGLKHEGKSKESSDQILIRPGKPEKGRQKMKIFDTYGRDYTDPVGVMEAFKDIYEAIGNPIFKNIVFDLDEGFIEYDATLSGKRIRKLFDMDQGTPELIADIMDWILGMLDAAANM